MHSFIRERARRGFSGDVGKPCKTRLCSNPESAPLTYRVAEGTNTRKPPLGNQRGYKKAKVSSPLPAGDEFGAGAKQRVAHLFPVCAPGFKASLEFVQV